MNEKVPKKLQARYEEITAIIDSVCQEYLNGEYADMSCKMAAALARKRCTGYFVYPQVIIP